MAMRAVKVTRKGQITLPAELRKEFGIEEGHVLYVAKGEHGIEIRTPGSFVARTAGIFRDYAAHLPPLEPDEIRELAAQAWLEDVVDELEIAKGDDSGRGRLSTAISSSTTSPISTRSTAPGPRP